MVRCEHPSDLVAQPIVEMHIAAAAAATQEVQSQTQSFNACPERQRSLLRRLRLRLRLRKCAGREGWDGAAPYPLEKL
eukprot:COSAG06_NODE_12454_length_1379_cov_2.244531_1_plen_78_part_00